MSTAANPMHTLYFRIASPALIGRAAILWPAGTWLRLVKPSPRTDMPMPTPLRATTTLSLGCRRMMGPWTFLAESSIMVEGSADGDVGGLDQLGHARHLRLHQVGELLARAGHDGEALVRDLPGQLPGLERGDRLGLELLHDGRRGACRGEQAVPRQHLEVVQLRGFGDGGHVREGRVTLEAGHGDGAQLARLDIGRDRGHVGEDHGNLAAHRVGESGGFALV